MVHLAAAGGLAVSPGWTPGMAYVHPTVLHCSGKRGKGLGLPVGKSQGRCPPGKDLMQWVLGTLKPYSRAPSSTSSRLGTSVTPALAGGMLSEEVVEPRLFLVPEGTGSEYHSHEATTRHMQGVWGSRIAISSNLLHFFFQQPSEPRLFNGGTQPSNLAQLTFPWGSCPSGHFCSFLDRDAVLAVG